MKIEATKEITRNEILSSTLEWVASEHPNIWLSGDCSMTALIEGENVYLIDFEEDIELMELHDEKCVRDEKEFKALSELFLEKPRENEKRRIKEIPANYDYDNTRKILLQTLEFFKRTDSANNKTEPGASKSIE